MLEKFSKNVNIEDINKSKVLGSNFTSCYVVLPISCGNSWQKTATHVDTPTYTSSVKATPIAIPSVALCTASAISTINETECIPGTDEKQTVNQTKV